MMKRILSLALACLLLCGLLPTFALAAGSASGTITLTDAYGKPGDSVIVYMDVEKNPGVMGAQFILEYDHDVLELTKTNMTKTKDWSSGGTGYVVFDADSNETFTGKMVAYTFKIKDTAKLGTTTVGMKVDAGTYEENTVSFVVNPATITINNSARPVFKTHALRLSGTIAVMFFMDLPTISGVDWSQSYMTFTISGKEIRANYDPTHMNASGKYYGFDCPTNSIQMAEPITAIFHYGNGLTVSEQYSIKQYMQVFQENENLFDAKTKALIRSIADYGHYVQPFLAKGKWVVGEDFEEMDLFYTNSYDLNAIKTAVADYAIVRQTSKDITSINYALALDSGTDIRVLFKPAKGYSGSISFAINGKKVEGKLQSDGRYMVVIPSIMSHELGKPHTVTAKTANGTATAQVSAISYVQGQLAASQDQATLNAVASLYKYYEASINYRATN